MTIAGDYSKTIKGGYDETHRLIMGYVQKSIPWVDADENMKEWARFTQQRRAFEVLIGDASPNNGFKSVGTGANNDFTLKGGDGTVNGAGRMYVRGIGCFLLSDINYANAGATPDQLSIFPAISFITQTTLPNDTVQDSAANFITNELVGRTITLDVKQPGITATVLANTANTIQVNHDVTTLGTGILVGAHYRVEVPAPPVSGTRLDDVYLNASIVENSTDPIIQHNLGTTITAQFFGQIAQTIYVKQGGGSVTTNYIDIDGMEHFLTKIATVTRIAGQAAINSPDVVDLRQTSGSLTAFVPKAGGTMTGDLQLNAANVVALTGTERVDGRLLHVDGAKLDSIDWSSSGVAGKLQLISWPVQGTDLSSISTSTVNVSRYLKGRIPGATTAQKGVFTDLPYNKAFFLDSTTDDQPQSPTGAPITGRLTFASQTLTGTLTFTFGSSNVVGAGSVFTSQLAVGDIIRGADSNWYTVATITNDLALVLVETYLGANAAATPTVMRQRWTLTLVTRPGGVDTTYTPATPINVSWFWHEVFDESTRPVINPFFGVPSDQLAAEIVPATTTVRGSALLALDDGSDSTVGHVVQASDVRLGKIKAQVNGASTTGLEPIVNFISGTSIGITITESGGKINITISNSAPGGGGLGLGSASPANVSSSGPTAGSSGNASHDDHVHKLDSTYAAKSDVRVQSTNTSIQSNAPLNFNPKLAVVIAATSTGTGTVGSVGIGNGSSQASINFQSSVIWNGAAIASTGSGSDAWTISQFTTAGVICTHTSGSSTTQAAILTMGDII